MLFSKHGDIVISRASQGGIEGLWQTARHQELLPNASTASERLSFLLHGRETMMTAVAGIAAKVIEGHVHAGSKHRPQHAWQF